MGDLGPVLWQEAFIRAVGETDRGNLARLIDEAERAIGTRRQQLPNPADYQYELRAMDLSQHALEAIKAQKLGGNKLA